MLYVWLKGKACFHQAQVEAVEGMSPVVTTPPSTIRPTPYHHTAQHRLSHQQRGVCHSPCARLMAVEALCSFLGGRCVMPSCRLSPLCEKTAVWHHYCGWSSESPTVCVHPCTGGQHVDHREHVGQRPPGSC